eukprot:TRINITY_DN31010_c0_g1_i2.p1 TRINITY_DN31010_c0_g1~~TRINITY_DN31010_c0_g1_i2.p1  ORF type:complete len:648 (-),score=90.19 TRINITY_DN31010_c0_g1_i2:193-2136(-)
MMGGMGHDGHAATDTKARILEILHMMEAKNAKLSYELEEREARLQEREAEIHELRKAQAELEMRCWTLEAQLVEVRRPEGVSLGEQLMSEMEGSREIERASFSGAPYATLSQNLSGVQHMLTRMSSFPELIALGLEQLLNTLVNKLRVCMDLYIDTDNGNSFDNDLETVISNNLCLQPNKANSFDEDSDDKENFVSFLRRSMRCATKSEAGFAFDIFPRDSDVGNSFVIDGSVMGNISSNPAAGLNLLFEKATGTWRLDMFDAHERSGNRSLQGVGAVAFAPYEAPVLQCSGDAVRKFLDEVTDNYFDQPYHNAVHAAQTCHSACWLSQAIGLPSLRPGVEQVALIVAALCHDINHFGRSNAFCINKRHELAMVYNDLHVLENMHSSQCFRILSGSQGSPLIENLASADYLVMRGQVIELILASDMSQHFLLLSKFRSRWNKPHFHRASATDSRLLAQMCLKAADLSHSALSWEAHHVWAERITQEFLDQGDEERRLGLAISPLCDRHGFLPTGLCNSQKFFLRVLCMPIFEELAGFLTRCEHERKPKDPPLEASSISSISSARGLAVDKFSSVPAGIASDLSLSRERCPRSAAKSGSALDHLKNLYIDSCIHQECITQIEINVANWEKQSDVANQIVERLLMLSGQ